ncbi:MBL fold metallo-hydrolase [Sphingobium sp. EP60837]|uniref:MBL fold metallo-hydrolase n=1 Tax=Sphingobium sp. EP60837 TaxID=1855519 RepID=UPI0007DDF5E1|nr:MBL fold metallo-hydrolase [Sphingobium sp. EP60837]ANI80215.1 hypothetical protein EP837_03837 [Sphingobium sp. EP60837]
MALENVKHWEIGDVRITRIVEVAAYAADIGMLLKDAGPEIFEPYLDWLKPNFVTEDGLMLMQWQAFAVQTPSRTLMIDTCIGNDRKLHFDIFNDMQTSFLEDLQASGIDPLKVDTVCCTHLHYDHVGWNTKLVDGAWMPTFPNARYLFDTTEYQEIRHLEEIGDWHGSHLPDAIDPIMAAGLHEFISAPGYQVCDEIRMEHTPGHTAGHCAIHIESRGERAVITGDLLHHPIQFAIPARHGSFDHDPVKGAQTRQKFVSENADGTIMVIGSHFSDPSAGWIIPDGDAWRFVTERPNAD